MKWRIVRRRRKRRSSITVHYQTHKEDARALVHVKLAQWSAVYGFSYNRVAIRNTRSCWGSCTSLKNLNFSYKILFLPESLQDYLIVHEVCHLKELNHKAEFWALVAQTIPDYKERMRALKAHEQAVRVL